LIPSVLSTGPQKYWLQSKPVILTSEPNILSCNTDPRQVVFVLNKDNLDRVVMIDFGYCFHGPNWRFPSYRSIGVFGEWYVYNAIKVMEAFEPWLQILENDSNEDVLASLASLIPPIWYDFDAIALKSLLTSLNERRKLVREMLRHCCSTNPHSFRNWMTPGGGQRYFVAHRTPVLILFGNPVFQYNIGIRQRSKVPILNRAMNEIRRGLPRLGHYLRATNKVRTRVRPAPQTKRTKLDGSGAETRGLVEICTATS
jgi:hypothetical protein